MHYIITLLCKTTMFRNDLVFLLYAITIYLYSLPVVWCTIHLLCTPIMYNNHNQNNPTGKSDQFLARQSFFSEREVPAGDGPRHVQGRIVVRRSKDKVTIRVIFR